MLVEVVCWIDRIWSSIEWVCCTCDPSVHLDVPSIIFVCVCQKLSSHSGVWALDHRCMLPSCCFFV